jgi:hypothetical protein
VQGPIRAIVADDLNSDDPARSIREWHEQREEETDQREEADTIVLVVEEKKEKTAC